MDKFEERLTDAQITSQNSQQLCTQYHKEAKQIMQQCKEHGNKLAQAESSLHALQISFIDQLEVLAAIFTNVQRKYTSLEQQLMIHTAHQKKIYANLADTFRKLKKQQIDPGLNIANEASLFHFVDADAVSTLQRELESVLGHLSQKKNSAQLAVGELQGRLDDVKHMVSLLLQDKCFLNGILQWAQSNEATQSPEDSLSSRFVEFHFHLMDADLSAITSILVAVSSLADRISAAKIRFARSGEQDLIDFQLQTIQNQVEQIPESVAKACDCLHRIKNVFQTLTKQSSLSNAPFLRCAQIKRRLEELVVSIEAANNKLLVFERCFQEFQSNVQFYCTELENLGLWYELYNVGYHELLFEIQRREDEEIRQKRLIKVIKKELAKLQEEENQKRQQFIEEHGRYLPASMFPTMQEPAAQFSLSVDIKPTPLPSLSQRYQREPKYNMDSQLEDSRTSTEQNRDESVLL